ncbi:hypothetical protein EDB81DRAFT_918127 [Dactylonectria macrodidyma]|uniref:Uncharacterized protein n=1 Tax=Dactylonectria macrodidyma TaxID=307937 RepID=A0A9P9FMZ3_9HYPO|nr:hypothetical protein EDB81DRAFT_918127 [Dactylonectria macrodidyma]
MDSDLPPYSSAARKVLASAHHQPSTSFKPGDQVESRPTAHWLNGSDEITKKLIRLNVYTTLSESDIVLACGWDGASRQFSSLASVLGHNYDWLKPTNESDMVRRITSLEARVGDGSPGQLSGKYDDQVVHGHWEFFGHDFVKPSELTAISSDFAIVVPGCEVWRAISRDGIILPSDFLNVDRYHHDPGDCLEGKGAHHLHKCVCVVFGLHRDRYWTTTDGIAVEATSLLREDATFSQETKCQDPFENTILHFLAARAEPTVLFKALAVFGAVPDVNSGRQTFLHCLGPQWFEVNRQKPLKFLLEYLRSLGFDFKQRDVYGSSVFHVLARRVPSTYTFLRKMIGEFSPELVFERDAFGPMPWMGLRSEEQPAALGRGFDRGGTGPRSKESRAYEFSLSTRNPFVHLNWLMRLVRNAKIDPRIEYDHGRNSLHCLAAGFPQTHSRADIEDSELVSGPQSHLRQQRTQANEECMNLCLGLLVDLISAGVDVGAYNSAGNTVLMEFVLHLPDELDHEHVHEQIPAVLVTLIEHGANIHARNRDGNTALHLAVRYGHKLAMRTLVEHGAVVHARNGQGQSPLQLLASQIGRSHLDAKAYSSLEACYAWLSSDAVGATLAPSAQDEWGMTHGWNSGSTKMIAAAPAAQIRNIMSELEGGQEKDSIPTKLEQMDSLPWSQWADDDMCGYDPFLFPRL